MASTLSPSELCARRRARLATAVGDGTVLVGGAALPERHDVRPRPAPNLYYLSGLEEPDGALLLEVRAGRIVDEVGYCRRRDPKHERWHGPLLGPRRARAKLGLAEVRAWPGNAELVGEACARGGRLWLDFASPLLASCAGGPGAKLGRVASMHDLRPLTTRLREVKDAGEIERIKAASSVTIAALAKVRAALGRARGEAQLAAILAACYGEAGGHHAFLPIVACGRNACVAHYFANRSRLGRGKLVLVDTGCELAGYPSDITRVYPVDGTFTSAQAEFYAVVLAAQRAAIAKARAGNSLAQVGHAANRTLARGLRELGICRGSIPRIMASEAFGRFVFHAIGHSLGLEVHDPLNRHDANGKALPLRRNMVVTIEPGMYLDDSPEVPAELRHTGIRIEDVVQITAARPKVLTEAAPKRLAELEAGR